MKKKDKVNTTSSENNNNTQIKCKIKDTMTNSTPTHRCNKFKRCSTNSNCKCNKNKWEKWVMAKWKKDTIKRKWVSKTKSSDF